ADDHGPLRLGHPLEHAGVEVDVPGNGLELAAGHLEGGGTLEERDGLVGVAVGGRGPDGCRGPVSSGGGRGRRGGWGRHERLLHVRTGGRGKNPAAPVSGYHIIRRAGELGRVRYAATRVREGSGRPGPPPRARGGARRRAAPRQN